MSLLWETRHKWVKNLSVPVKMLVPVNGRCTCISLYVSHLRVQVHVDFLLPLFVLVVQCLLSLFVLILSYYGFWLSLFYHFIVCAYALCMLKIVEEPTSKTFYYIPVYLI